MKIALPADPRARRLNMVVLKGCGPDALAAINETYLPWTDAWCTPGEDAAFSISAIPILMRLPGCEGLADQRTKDRVRRWLAEARLTTSRTAIIKRTSDYPWIDLLSTEYVPRRYQLAGMDRLWARVIDPKRTSRGQILKDDVGTGKTAQIAGIIARMIEEGACNSSKPIIVSSSPSVVGQWHDELRRFVLALNAPGLVSAVSGDKSKRLYRLKPGATVYVIHHQMLRLPQYREPVEALFRRSVGAILDESSAFANHDSLTTRRARQLCRGLSFVIATNATPIENKLSDTFGQMSVVDEPVLGSFECFANRYVTIHPRYGTEIGQRNTPELRLRLAGSWFGRRHEDVGSEMPKVVSEVRSVTAGKAQRIAYKAAADGFVTNDETGAVGLAKLASVERAALAADLANPKSESAKLDDLIELLDGEVSTQRVLIFTKYRQCAVFASIKLARFKPYMIHGGVSLAQRDDIRRRFCSAGGLGRILIGTEAMARGLNLQDASVVVNLDLPWNHAKLRQRVGRVARIGQKSRSVLVISYVAEGFAYAPIDRYFLGLVRKKRDLSDRVYGEDSVDELDSAPVDLGAVRAFLRSR